jgi:polar amino acid transport system permease protein
VLEVIAQAAFVGSTTARYIEPYTMAGALFFAISYPAARLVKLLEARLR